MKRTINALTLAALALTTACAQPLSAPAQLNRKPQGLSKNETKIRYTAVCIARVHASECPGAYGFEIHEDGRFKVGPGPAGERIEGELSAEDAALAKLGFASLSELASDEGERCVPASAPNANFDFIGLTRGSFETALVRASATEFCFRADARAAAENVHSLLLELAARYYPLPFPNPLAE